MKSIFKPPIKPSMVPDRVFELVAIEEYMGKHPARELSREFNQMILAIKTNPRKAFEHSLKAEQLAEIMLIGNGGEQEEVKRKFRLFRSYLSDFMYSACTRMVRELKELLEDRGIVITPII